MPEEGVRRTKEFKSSKGSGEELSRAPAAAAVVVVVPAPLTEANNKGGTGISMGHTRCASENAMERLMYPPPNPSLAEVVGGTPPGTVPPGWLERKSYTRASSAPMGMDRVTSPVIKPPLSLLALRG